MTSDKIQAYIFDSIVDGDSWDMLWDIIFELSDAKLEELSGKKITKDEE